MTTPDQGERKDIRDVLNKIIEGKVNANRVYVDEVLEKIQDQNRKYYLDKLTIEVTRMELEEKAGNLHGAYHHKVMVDVYKFILEKSFADTD